MTQNNLCLIAEHLPSSNNLNYLKQWFFFQGKVGKKDSWNC